MRDAARTLASYGRNGDDMLVHVSRKELEGIRALTGRDFTRNPDTGLPEAFNFASLLPIAAGIGASILTGGAAAPLVGAAASGVTSAGLAAARGASAQDALTQGLISGATSYAGGQLLSGVGEAAGAATSAGAPSVPGSFGGDVAVPPVNIPTAPAAAGDSIGQALQSANLQTGYNPAGQAIGTPAPSIPAPATPAAQTVGERAAAFGNRLSNIASDPMAAASKIGENISNNRFSALIAGGGMLAQANDMFGDQRRMPGEPEYDPNKYPEQFPTTPRSFTPPPAGYRPGAGPEYRYFAEGGLASVRKDEGYTANVMNEAKAALLGEHPRPREAIMRFREAFGDDALNLLRDRISPGRVRGAGGGMDDLVPGSIEGRQKVRLADGEFVVPADVVSGLGDGSTDQGVRKLHGLMDKVRQQRTGMKAQPKAIGGKITL
jgi:hypothetical protein